MHDAIGFACLLRGTYVECVAASNIISADTGRNAPVCRAGGAKSERRMRKKQCMVIILENAKAVASV